MRAPPLSATPKARCERQIIQAVSPDLRRLNAPAGDGSWTVVRTNNATQRQRAVAAFGQTAVNRIVAADATVLQKRSDRDIEVGGVHDDAAVPT